jgi:hypothetical protein
MKKLVYILLFPLLIGTSSVTHAREYNDDYLGLPGDNLNLFAVMKLFQESETLEGFERNLNDENSRINNLDLNGDNRIDYIRVIDNTDRNIHMIVLQVAINARENQDVAVFYVEREADNQVRIQLIGDEALYGKSYIVEPNYDAYGNNETPNPGYTGNTRYVEGQTVVVNRVTTYEVAAWPLVRFIFLPTYVVWHSPWFWDYYPHWWSPWRPYYWHYYYGYHYNCYPHYYGYYRHTHYHHHHDYWNNNYYSSRRNYSPYVSERINTGYYKSTYSRPETRRAGSDLYTRTVASANGRTATRTLGNSQVKGTSARTSGTSEYQRRETSSRSSGVNNTKSAPRTIGATTNRTARSTEAATSSSAVRTENKKAAAPDSRVSSSSSVKTETKRSSAGRATNNPSQSRSTTGSNQVKSRSSSSSVDKETVDRTQRSSGGRR